MENKPQTDRRHPDEIQDDPNPNRMAGRNTGPRSAGTEATGTKANDPKPVHRKFCDRADDDLKRIPVPTDGSGLQQGGTYLDLNDGARGQFAATGEMRAGPGDAGVPKDVTPYPIRNRLLGIEDPERLWSGGP